MKFILFALPLLALSSCSQSSSTSTEQKNIPFLKSSTRETSWGKAKKSQSADGYELSYKNPQNRSESLTIKGSPNFFFGLTYPPDIKGEKLVDGKMIETRTPQVWQKTKVAGKNIYFYQSHFPMRGRGPRFKTLCTNFQAPNGAEGFYLIEIEGTKNQAQQWLSELNLRH